MERLTLFAAALGLFFASACGGLPKPETPELDDGRVAFEGALATPLLRSDAPAEVIARIHVKSQPPAEKTRAPVNIALVIDTSGSMEGKPIADATRASLAMIDGLKNGDRLAVVVFHSKTDVLLPSTELSDDNRAEIKTKVAKMRALGTTDLVGGLSAGIAEVTNHYQARGINRVVLMGDGVPNVDTSLRDMAKSAGSRGVTITSFGLGPEYDESLMGELAQLSGGQFHYVEESSKVAAFFRDEVLRLDGAMLKNAVLTLTPGPGVRIQEVIGRPTLQNGNGLGVPLGDFSRDEARDVFVRLAVSAHRADAPVELLDGWLQFDDAGASGAHMERRVFLGAHTSSDERKVESARNRGVEDDALLAEGAAITLRAIQVARAGDPTTARALLEQGAKTLEDASRRDGNKALGDQAKSMRALMSDLPKPTTAKTGSLAPSPSPVSSPDMLRAHDASLQRLH